MANRRDLVKRRKSVRNIRKITRTMQLIATARFQAAMSRAIATKPYASTMGNMVAAAAQSATNLDQPLLKVNDSGQTAILVLTSNRGFCGGYNGNVLRLAMETVAGKKSDGIDVSLNAVGKKGIAYLRFLGEEMDMQDGSIEEQPRFEQVSGIADSMMEAYREKRIASLHVCYMQFISTGVQKPVITQLLPIAGLDGAEDDAESNGEAPKPGTGTKIDFSPEPAELLDELLPASVRMRLFQCFTDAAASEQVARMIAMKAATDAAGDMIKLLTQKYNRARQTAITMELLDIIGGAAAIS
ncbi:MAG: ATP synthase F1 subunit gamma [Planctomycetes bacterium]|nr:ATP synthase F1 subunit gamma [Planctomycetota bacterium]